MNKKLSFLLLSLYTLQGDRVNHTYLSISSYRDESFSIPYHPLQNIKDLDPLLEEIGDAKIVLLGESTHGTHEYYEWRTAITKRLIKEKGFSLVAIEGDRSDSYRINQFINGPPQDSLAVLHLLKQNYRWPTWLWSNVEMVRLIQWLNDYHQQEHEMIGFYGLDLYSFWDWTKNELPIKDTALGTVIQKIKDFFAPYDNDAMKYAKAIREGRPDGSALTEEFWKKVRQFSGNKFPLTEAEFKLQEEALLALDGEKYFRISSSNHVSALNLRDRHMAMIANRILQFHGPAAKLIIWAHNGHTGNARYSDASSSGYTSLGEILKNTKGQTTFAVGFGTNKGFVTAAYFWNGDTQTQVVPPAKTGSWEDLLHQVNKENKLILSKELGNDFNKWIPTRSIGVTYSGAAIYNNSILPKRFDAFLFIDSTTSTQPLE